MKIDAAILAMLFGLSMCGVSCCSHGEKPKNSMESRPVFDRGLGILEKDVLRKYGEPKETHTRPAAELKGELRAGLKARVASEDVLVRELYYKLDKKERIFWLTQQNGDWKVISDVEIPEGAFF
jgi:hypothetical protein